MSRLPGVSASARRSMSRSRSNSSRCAVIEMYSPAAMNDESGEPASRTTPARCARRTEISETLVTSRRTCRRRRRAAARDVAMLLFVRHLRSVPVVPSDMPQDRTVRCATPKGRRWASREQHRGSASTSATLGWSDWKTVTQEQVNLFATRRDHQWIHVDPERARRAVRRSDRARLPHAVADPVHGGHDPLDGVRWA